jgi:hypothetical protein
MRCHLIDYILVILNPLDHRFVDFREEASLLDPLARGQAVDTAALRAVMTTAFGGSDADGAWDWKTAYDAGEAATVLFLRKFGSGMRGSAGSAAALLAMLAKVAAPLPHIRAAPKRARRSSSVPRRSRSASPPPRPPRSRTRSRARAFGRHGLLAIFAELTRGGLVLNELADARAAPLRRLFPNVPLTRHDAAHIHDHLDTAVRPRVVSVCHNTVSCVEK